MENFKTEKPTAREDFIVDILPAFSTNNVAICLAVNEEFAPYASVLIQSILEQSSPQNNYDILILHSSVLEATQKRIISISSQNQNFSIRFVETTQFFKNIELPVHSHFTQETYYRLRIPSICKNYKKILYIDADAIVRHDVAYLYNIDIDDHYYLAAVHDRDIKKWCEEKKACPIPEIGAVETDKYLREYVRMKDPSNYFQAGVILFNVAVLLKMEIEDKSMKMIAKKRYWLLDQDILNKIVEGHVKYLDDTWNTFHLTRNPVPSYLRWLPEKKIERYLLSLKKPFIIHFAGPIKPWKLHYTNYSQIFWKVAQKTPWQEELQQLHLSMAAKTNLANYNSLSNDPFIKIYQKIRSNLGLKDILTMNETEEAKLQTYLTLNKDPIVIFYRKIRQIGRIVFGR